MHLLIVEDDPQVRAVVSRVASSAGIRTVQAATIQEARQFVADADLIVLDLVLTNGAGLDLLAELRRDGNPVPVAVLTGLGSVESAVRAIRLGCEDYVEKPARPSEILEMLRRLVRRRPGADPNDKQRAILEQIGARLRDMRRELQA